MAKWNQLVITDAGYQLSAKTLSGKKIQYTHAQTTDKDMSSMTSDELKSLTKLESVVQDLPVGVVSVQDDHTVNVPVKVTNQDVTADYLLYGLAIFAKSEDGNEVLYGIATADKPDLMVAQDGETIVGTNFWLKVHVGSADNVNIVISPDGSISNEELEGILKQYVLDSDFSAALADYVKKDEVAGLIPDDIATTKNLADGDATTLKSAKEYADAQASDKVKNADTANWQKAKISADDGSPKSFLYAKDNGNITMWIAGRPLGMHTFWCAAGVTGNPVSSSIQGTMSISSVKNGVGYCVSADNDFISITLVDGQVSYSVLANAANVVDRNPDTGTVSKPTDFTNLTVNGGKSVATRDDLKSLEASAWLSLGMPKGSYLNTTGETTTTNLIGEPLYMKFDSSTGITTLSGGLLFSPSQTLSSRSTWSGELVTLPNGFDIYNDDLKEFILLLLSNSTSTTFESVSKNGKIISGSIIYQGGPVGYKDGISVIGSVGANYRQYITNLTTGLIKKV